jgi:hypothetical protein
MKAVELALETRHQAEVDRRIAALEDLQKFIDRPSRLVQVLARMERMIQVGRGAW